MKEILSGKTLKSRLLREGGGNLILRGVYILFSFGIGVFLARLMGAEDYGVYTYVYAIIMVLVVPAQFGFPMLVVRETAQFIEKKEWGKVRGLWQWGNLITIVLSVIIIVGAFVFLLIARERVDQNYRITLYWGLILLPLIAFSGLRGASLRGLQKIIQGQLPEQVLVPGFFIILLVLSGFVFTQKISPNLAMMYQAFAAFLAFLIGAVMLVFATPKELKTAKPQFENKRWVSSSFSLALISGMGLLNKWLSIIILGLFVPSAQIGIYRVAVQMAVLADFGTMVVNPVIAPQIARLYAVNDKKRLQRLATGSARVMLFFNLLITVGFLLLGRQFIKIFFGSEFTSAFGALLILLVGQLVNSFTGSVVFLLNMTGFEKKTLWARVFTTVGNCLLVLILSPLIGISGAAIGASTSLIIWNVFLWRLVKKHLNINSLAFGKVDNL